jgi:hypothetical protein
MPRKQHGVLHSTIWVCREDNFEVDGGLRAAEFDDRLEICTSNRSGLGARWRAIEGDLERNQAVASVVANPKHLDPQIIIDVSEYFEFFWAIDKLDHRKNLFGHDR